MAAGAQGALGWSVSGAEDQDSALLQEYMRLEVTRGAEARKSAAGTTSNLEELKECFNASGAFCPCSCAWS